MRRRKSAEQKCGYDRRNDRLEPSCCNELVEHTRSLNACSLCDMMCCTDCFTGCDWCQTIWCYRCSNPDLEGYLQGHECRGRDHDDRDGFFFDYYY